MEHITDEEKTNAIPSMKYDKGGYSDRVGETNSLRRECARSVYVWGDARQKSIALHSTAHSPPYIWENRQGHSHSRINTAMPVCLYYYPA